jgi:hypothetical protein
MWRARPCSSMYLIHVTVLLLTVWNTAITYSLLKCLKLVINKFSAEYKRFLCVWQVGNRTITSEVLFRWTAFAIRCMISLYLLRTVICGPKMPCKKEDLCVCMSCLSPVRVLHVVGWWHWNNACKPEYQLSATLFVQAKRSYAVSWWIHTSVGKIVAHSQIPVQSMTAVQAFSPAWACCQPLSNASAKLSVGTIANADSKQTAIIHHLFYNHFTCTFLRTLRYKLK